MNKTFLIVKTKSLEKQQNASANSGVNKVFKSEMCGKQIKTFS